MKITEHQAQINGRDLPISTKQAVEICNFIRGKLTTKAKAMLQRVLMMKDAIPMKRFNKDTGHKPGRIAAGRYPIKATSEILKLIEGVEANAQNKGLDPTYLLITVIIANKASTPWRYGRQRRRKAKRTHINIVVDEVESKEKPKTETKSKAKVPKKSEEKSEKKEKSLQKTKESTKKETNSSKNKPKEEKPDKK